MKKHPVFDGAKNHKCQQTAWMRSVSRALELLSGRLQDVERENFVLRIAVGVAVFAAVGIAGYQFVFNSVDRDILIPSKSVNRYDPVERDELEENDRLTTSAWNALNDGNYQQAIDASQKCIDLYARFADEEQRQLIESGSPRPHIGKIHPLSEEEIETIMCRGLLNNVAACLFVQGLTYEHLDRLKEAMEAYRKVLRYVHARVYDPFEKKFWSPEQACQDKLKELKDRQKQNIDVETPINEPIISG